MPIFLHRLLSLFLAAAILLPSLLAQAPPPGPLIHDITTNLGGYAGGQVPRFAKLEIIFQVDTSAANLQMPYDASPPAGIQAGMGVSVDALFSADSWQTVYSQPAFFYQGFLDEVKGSREWFYPSGSDAWKVRFAPDRVGAWQYKLRVRDRSGISETPAASFTVAESAEKGPLRVSPKDPRYFETQDGTYFPALGYNLNFNDISWTNPLLDNQENFTRMSENGIQLVRMWLSQWAIYGSAWNPWHSINPDQHAQVIPYTGLTFEQAYGDSEISLRIDAAENPCMFAGFLQAPAAVKANTTYRVRVRFRAEEMRGPRVWGKPYGFVAKTGGWLWGDGTACSDPGSGTVLTPYQALDTAGWQMLEGELRTGNEDFLPFFYLALENVRRGKAYVDTVWIQEDLGGGRLGPNILSKPWMAHHLYMDQRNSFAFDKVLQLAEQHNIALRLVVQEKNDWIFNRFDFTGKPIADDEQCWDADQSNDPAQCPGNQWFYGNWDELTKTRWLQQAYWRYLQARWGYSTSIHSWELLNEGDPFNSAHYALAEAFARYMHQFKPNDHLVSTSFWHSFPRDEFWANPAYSTVDFADIHHYIAQDDPLFADTALATASLSLEIGAKQPGGAGKPLLRGETGFVESGSGPSALGLNADTQGAWLHDFVWGGINPGGMIESYWYADEAIYRMKDGAVVFDHRDVYRAYYNFIKDIPLSNGNYQDAGAVTSQADLRAWGQKDLVNGRAHLWIQNARHTWQAVVDGTPVPALSATVRIAGFRPSTPYLVQWWDTYQPDAARQVLRAETLTTTADGVLAIQVMGLTSDTALQVTPSNTAAETSRGIRIPFPWRGFYTR